MTTRAFQTLIEVERARKYPSTTTIEIVQETTREAVVLFDLGDGERHHRILSKRNKSETSALGVVHMFLNGELPLHPDAL
jgi:hypothetical protein